MLVSYRGTVKAGNIELEKPVHLPDGAEVLVIIATPENAVLQEAHLASPQQTEWQEPFDEYQALVEQQPAEEDIAAISDEELVELVHQVRTKK